MSNWKEFTSSVDWTLNDAGWMDRTQNWMDGLDFHFGNEAKDKWEWGILP